MKKLLVMDIGGTFIKYGLANEQGKLLPETVDQTPSHAEESADAVLEALRQVIRNVSEHEDIAGASVDIPGPFDYSNGVSYMRHKFQALYGHSLKPPFEEAGLSVSFLHDSTAFILGEYFDGVLTGSRNSCCVMLGTGLGFALMRDGKVCVDETQTPAVCLWNMPYLEGIAEDQVSTRAIQRRYGEMLGVKEIAGRAYAGDKKARAAFRETGKHLSGLVHQMINRYGCDRFALGGQISKSADLFELEIQVPWGVTAHPDDAALRGACAYALRGPENCTTILKG